MRKFGMLLMSFLVMSLCVVAQNNSRSGEARRGGNRMMDKETMAQRMTQRQVSRLSLTDAQAEQLKTINLEYVTQMQEMGRPGDTARPKPEADSLKNKKMTKEMKKKAKEAEKAAKKEEKKDTRQDKMKTLREDYNAKVKAILTPEQYAQFEKMQNERPQGRQRGPRNGQGGFGGGQRGFGGGQGNFDNGGANGGGWD